MSTLRDNLVKLAFDNPGEVRDALLPILAKTAGGPGVMFKEDTEWGPAVRWKGTEWKPAGGLAGMSDYHWADPKNQIAFTLDASGGLSMVYNGFHWSLKRTLKKDRGISNKHIIEGTPIARQTWKALVGGNESVLSQWKKDDAVNDWYLKSIMRVASSPATKKKAGNLEQKVSVWVSKGLKLIKIIQDDAALHPQTARMLVNLKRELHEVDHLAGL